MIKIRTHKSKIIKLKDYKIKNNYFLAGLILCIFSGTFILIANISERFPIGVNYNINDIGENLYISDENGYDDPIYIFGNDGFAIRAWEMGWNGSGIIEDPYIIKNYKINATNDHGIAIRNTNVYFIIENVLVINGSDNGKIGFYLENVNNGILRNNSAINNYHGFYLIDSNYNTFTRNNALNNSWDGFVLRNSNDIILSSNTANNNNRYGFNLGQDLYGRHNFVFNNTANNNILHGFYLYDFRDNTMNQNNANNNGGYGIYLYLSWYNIISRNTLLNNGQGCIIVVNGGNNNVFDNYCDESPPSIPHPFTLTSTADDPDSDGAFTLIWTESIFADEYVIYQNGIFIAIVNNLEILEYNVINLPTGEYTFYVKAMNAYGITESNQIIMNVGLVPLEFILDSDAADPDPDGTFTLAWTQSEHADNYTIYQDGEIIAEGLTIREFQIMSLATGEYIFTILAFNQYGNSTSNTIQVNIGLIPLGFILNLIDVPDNDGNFDLTWTASSGASNYSIYQYSGFITEINGSLILLENEITDLSLTLSEYSDGTYYFIVVAYNDYGDTLSNCITVVVAIPPTWDQILVNQIIEFGEDFDYQANASDLSDIDYYWINNTSYFTTDESGRIINNITLEVGIYHLEVRAYDPHGNYCTATIQITVQDTTNPIWIELPTDQFIEFSTLFSYDVNASDPSGIDTYWLNDTIHFQIDGNGVISNNSFLLVGEYWLEIRAYDQFGNNISDIIKITVEDTTPPTWVITPEDQLIELGESVYYDLDAYDLSYIGSWEINDTIYFSIDSNGIITNITELEVRVFYLEVRVYDSYGNNISAPIIITVKDTTAPTININSPTPNELFETTAPNFTIEIYDINLDTMWYTLDFGLTNTTFAENGTIEQSVWDTLLDGNVVIRFYANDSAGNIGFAEVTIRKDVNAPIITINNPQNSDVIEAIAPNFDISIDELNLDKTWYSLNGGNNVTFTGLTGTINQALWDALSEGNVIIRFYANDTLGRVEFAEVTIRKDDTAPTININSPAPNEMYGTSAPSFNVEIYDANIDSMWYTLDNGLTNTTFTTNGTIYQSAWDTLPDGTISIIFYANDSAGNIGFAEVTIRKDVNAPIITINNPQDSVVIGATAPSFDISIDELNLDKTWYSLNGGNNVTFTGLTGTINQGLWDALPEGNVIIRFYANDTLGRIGFQEVTVVKDISQPSPPGIPGYNVFLLLGIISIVAVIIIKKRLNHLN